MSSPDDIAESAGAGWQPDVPITLPPPLLWPPRPLKVLAYLFGFPGLYFPWLTLYALIALGLWLLLQLLHADFTHLLAGWPLVLLACNELIAAAFYGAWHYRLYSRRAQGAKFKYNPGWPRQRDERFLFAQQTRCNVFWALGSGVPVASAYMILTLWAQASGIAPVTTWHRSPVYCTVLMLVLVFFHAVHFYVFHRLLHVKPLYRTIHYLHHQNLLYLSGALLLWVIPATPLHVLYYVTLVALAPAEGHCGFGRMMLGKSSFPTDNYYHYLHHKFFRVNFGDPLLIPLDRLLGTFHDGTRRVSGILESRDK
jgi:sterol desaturase/sphingolipid hydroxylase (fatty acid hydroxylase superfamily)